MDEKLIEARLLLEAQLSHSEIHTKLRDALKAQHPGYWCWMAEVYDDAVIYELSMKNAEEAKSRYFRCSYSLGENDSLTLGLDAVEVTKKVTWEPVVPAPLAAAESEDGEIVGDFVPLLEGAIRKDGTVAVKIIQPGQGSSGFYPAEVLERDGPKVFKRGLQMFADHATPAEEAQRPEGSIKNLVGELTTDAYWDAQGTKGPGLYAEAKVFDAWRPVIEDMAPSIGLSINALGKYRTGEIEGQTMPIVDSIVAAKSVDWVTKAGAGGQVVTLFEAARSRAVTRPQSGGETDVDETKLKEAEAAREAALAEAKELREKNAKLESENAQLKEAGIISRATEVAEGVIGGYADLHELTRARLVKEAVKGLPLKDGALDEEGLKEAAKKLADEALKEFAAVTGSGQVRGMGGGDGLPAGGGESKVDLTESFKRLGLSAEEAAIAAKGR